MTEPPAPERISVHWSPEARADLRSIDREPAMQILYCVDRYLASRTGDVKKLKPPLTGFRLRGGDYRVFFDLKTAKRGCCAAHLCNNRCLYEAGQVCTLNRPL